MHIIYSSLKGIEFFDAGNGFCGEGDYDYKYDKNITYDGIGDGNLSGNGIFFSVDLSFNKDTF